jgi:hypothetical protein
MPPPDETDRVHATASHDLIPVSVENADVDQFVLFVDSAGEAIDATVLIVPIAANTMGADVFAHGC